MNNQMKQEVRSILQHQLRPIPSAGGSTGEPLVGMIEPTQIVVEGEKKIDGIIKTIDDEIKDVDF